MIPLYGTTLLFTLSKKHLENLKKKLKIAFTIKHSTNNNTKLLLLTNLQPEKKNLLQFHKDYISFLV